MAKDTLQRDAIPTDPDITLIRRLARGEESALDELYQRFAPGLLVYLARRLNDPRLAEEVLQDVMLAVWRSAPRFRGECRLGTWLLTIARNRAINAYHRQVVPAASVLPLEDPDDARYLFTPDPTEPHHELYEAIASLPDEFRETLELVFFHGLSLAETAHVLDVPGGTVKSRLHRAKERLRFMMKPDMEEHDSAH